MQDVRRFAERVAARVPEGEPILFTLGEGGDDEFFLSMWTAYYLPRHRVLRRQNVPPGTPRPRYRIDFPSWPPGGSGQEMGVSQGVTGSRKLLHGLGTLWYRPPTLGASRSDAEDSGR